MQRLIGLLLLIFVPLATMAQTDYLIHDDLDKLTLKEYDDLCGIKRKYISTRKMARIRQRVKDRQRVKIATSHREMN